MKDYQIFISYRRDGGEFLAGRLSDKLTDNGYEVFYDVESMRSGPFNAQIYEAIEKCSDVLLVLPPKALDRCADEEDWVRKEIEHALKCNKNIIPLLMPGFSFPENMPESIASISFCEGVAVNSQYFSAMLERIEDLIEASPKPKNNGNSGVLKDGIRFLNRKMFAQALACFEKVINEDISEPDAYFYAAVAKLEGKRPFMISRNMINEIEKYIESAIAYGEHAVYYCFYAYLKLDYYEKKMLKTPLTHKELLATAKSLGITDEEITELFELLGTQKPVEF